MVEHIEVTEPKHIRKMLSTIFLTLLPALSHAQQIARDPGIGGTPLEIVHLYNDQWPTGNATTPFNMKPFTHLSELRRLILLSTGITVSRTGRKFSNYPSGLDANNTNTGSNNKYAVAELTSNATEKAYPSIEINNPPGGAINYTTTPPSGANYKNYLIGVQSVVLDAKDRLWILDTGRALTPDGVLVLASYGGPKLIGVDISTNSVIKTIIFPTTVAFGDSYLNDIRFDLRASASSSGQGMAYITDSSSEGRNGIVVVDLGSGESWRHLDGIPEVKAERYVDYY